MWLYLSLISAVFGGLTAVIMKKCSSKNDAIRISVLGLLIGNTAYVLLGACTTDVLQTFDVTNLIKVMPLSLIQSVGYLFAILSVKYASVSTVSPIRKGNTVVTMLLGIVLLQETFTVVQLLLSFLLIALTILLAKTGKSQMNMSETKGIAYAYGFVVFNGIAGFLNKVYINIFGNPMIVVFYYGVVILIGVLLYCLITHHWSYLDIRKINVKGMFLLHAILDLVANLCSRFSLINGDVSIVSVITSSSIIITILGSRVILKEKISRRKYVMIIGVILCVFMLAIVKS